MPFFSDAIFTPRLKLRKMTLDDLPLIHTWSNDHQAYGPYLTPDNMSKKSCQEHLLSGASWTEKNKCFMIALRQEEAIGTTRFWLRPEREECAMMQIKIACPDQRKNGYGTEAQKYLIMHLFNVAKVDCVEMYTDVNNTAQQRCLNKLGFENVESVSYQDHHILRIGYLYRLTQDRFNKYPVYHYHYE